MAKDKKFYDDDDGRTIVDMSGLERPSMFGHLPGSRENRAFKAPEERKPHRPGEESGWSRSERGAAVRGALAASLLIAGAYIVGLGAIIAVIYFIATRVI